jgi:predicted Zn finger-like uncharacterized protein
MLFTVSKPEPCGGLSRRLFSRLHLIAAGMILTCPACSTRYQADAAKFPPEGRDVRCAKCSHVWRQAGPEPEYVAPPEPVAEAVPEPAPAYQAPPPPPPEPVPESYAQVRVRDLEPQPQAEVQAAEVRRPLSSSPVVLKAGWIVLGLAVVAVFACAYLFRQQIAGAWPQSASVYAALGVKVNTAGLEFEDYAYHQDVQDGKVVLTVTGSIRNITARELPVPQVRVGLVDDERRELYHWTFAPEVMTLRPGQTTRFVTRLSSPPEGARQLNLRFAKAGE